MSLAAALAAIRSRAETLWPGIEPLVPLAWQNEAPPPLVGSDGAPVPFVLIQLRWNGGEFVSIGAPGSNIARREGHIWCLAFLPQGEGASRAMQLAGEAAGLFEGQYFSGLVCEAMQPGGAADGEGENGNYYGESAVVPFFFDETA